MRTVVVALLSVCLIASCSIAPRFTFYNGSDEPVRILLGGDEVRVNRGAAKNFMAPVVPDEQSGFLTVGGDLVVSTPSCRLVFSVDDVADRLDWRMSLRGIPIQLEASHALYFLPHGTRLPAQAQELEAAHRDGFAVQPHTSDCASLAKHGEPRTRRGRRRSKKV